LQPVDANIKIEQPHDALRLAFSLGKEYYYLKVKDKWEC
jgi:hypothetical protein